MVKLSESYLIPEAIPSKCPIYNKCPFNRECLKHNIAWSPMVCIALFRLILKGWVKPV